MKIRRAHLGMIAFAGGNMVSLVLTFPRDMTFIFGSVWTRVILAAAITAMVPFIVSQSVHGFRESGVRGLLGEAAFAFMALAAFALALFVVHPGPDAIGRYEIVAYALPVSVLCLAWIRYRDRATRVELAATAPGREV